MHEMRAGREDAERELGGVVMVYDQVRGDWHKKLRDRRKEVRGMVEKVAAAGECWRQRWVRHCGVRGACQDPELRLAAPLALLHCCSLLPLPLVPLAQVRDLERRKAEEVQRKEQAAAAVAEKARLEADKSERSKCVRGRRELAGWGAGLLSSAVVDVTG